MATELPNMRAVDDDDIRHSRVVVIPAALAESLLSTLALSWRPVRQAGDDQTYARLLRDYDRLNRYVR